MNFSKPPEALEALDDTIIRVALLLSYRGDAFNGSQYQHHHGRVLPTVESALRSALIQLGFPQTVRPMFASRTDAGVHALGQVVRLNLPRAHFNKFKDFRRALNSALPDAAAILKVAQNVSPAFHVRHSPKLRRYLYQVINTPVRPVLLSPNAIWIEPRHGLLDVDLMQTAANVLVGEHKFTSFKNPDTAVIDDICNIQSFRVTQATDGLIRFDAAGTRFLYQMVRIMVGTILKLADPKHPKTAATAAKQMQQILNAQNRQAAGFTAPAQGLTLMGIDYPPPFEYFIKA